MTARRQAFNCLKSEPRSVSLTGPNGPDKQGVEREKQGVEGVEQERKASNRDRRTGNQCAGGDRPRGNGVDHLYWGLCSPWAAGPAKKGQNQCESIDDIQNQTSRPMRIWNSAWRRARFAILTVRSCFEPRTSKCLHPGLRWPPTSSHRSISARPESRRA